MTDFFKSAFGLFGNNNVNGGGSVTTSSQPNNVSSFSSTSTNSVASNEFVGQTIVIGSYKLKITKLLAEGGFAIVYLAVDLTTGIEYALKRIFSADEQSNKAVREEISYLKQLVNHPNIINFISAACEETTNSSSRNNTKEFLILTELCKDPLIDHLRAGLSTPAGAAFDFNQVLQIFYQICQSVQYLHSQTPMPIIHRDLKLENFLVSQKYQIKLCDFGSATTQSYQPDQTWSVNKRSLIEDEIAKQTTPMYRAPEMLDLYNNYKIDTQADIWALGCVLFVLCFNKHPFEDAAKLRIINGKYQIPQQDREFIEFHDLLRTMFDCDPSKRPNINEVFYCLENIAQSKSILFEKNLNFLKKTELLLPSHLNSIQNSLSNISITQQQHQQQQQTVNNTNWMGNASSLFKTIKDASNKVIDSVQSMNKTELDISYITSRLIVMSCPTEGIESAAFGNHIDFIKEALESKHGRNYRIYNLANKTYKKEKFSQVIDVGTNLSVNKAPPISLMTKMCSNIVKFLNENSQNVCVINCVDGRNISAIGVSTLIMYCNLIKNVDSCLNLFHVKRGGNVFLTSGQYKYLKDTQKLFANYRSELNNKPLVLSPNECVLSSIVLIGIPLFNRLRLVFLLLLISKLLKINNLKF